MNPVAIHSSIAGCDITPAPVTGSGRRKRAIHIPPTEANVNNLAGDVVCSLSADGIAEVIIAE